MARISARRRKPSDSTCNIGESFHVWAAPRDFSRATKFAAVESTRPAATKDVFFCVPSMVLIGYERVRYCARAGVWSNCGRDLRARHLDLVPAPKVDVFLISPEAFSMTGDAANSVAAPATLASAIPVSNCRNGFGTFFRCAML